jgi:hypothetical protein
MVVFRKQLWPIRAQPMISSPRRKQNYPLMKFDGPYMHQWKTTNSPFTMIAELLFFLSLTAITAIASSGKLA